MGIPTHVQTLVSSDPEFFFEDRIRALGIGRTISGTKTKVDRQPIQMEPSERDAKPQSNQPISSS